MSDRSLCTYHNNLAPSHGRCTDDVQKNIDDKLKKLNVGTIKKLCQLDNNWPSVQHAIMQYNFVTSESNEIHRIDKLVEGNRNAFVETINFSDPAAATKVCFRMSQPLHVVRFTRFGSNTYYI